MKKAFLIFFTAILIVVGYILITTLLVKDLQSKYNPASASEVGQYPYAQKNLARALTFPTISHKPEMLDTSAFAGFLQFLSETYPLTFQNAIDTFGTHSLLIKIEGTDLALKPALFMGHMDVVPVPSNTLSQWKKPPFEALSLKDSLYGRGTLDDKLGVIGLLESTEHLLSSGRRNKRTYYLAFGQDEEIGGNLGALSIANYFSENQLPLEFVMDEGGILAENIVPGIKGRVALIGIAEKGYASFKLSVRYPGGHSSMPEVENSITILSSALEKIQKKPMPAEFTSPILGFMDHLGPHLPFLQRMAFAHPKLFGAIIESAYDKSSAGRALIHTTIAPTIFRGGIKDNIIPNYAEITLNFRILPGTSIESIEAYLQNTISDERIEITKEENFNLPEGVADYSNQHFIKLGKAIRETYPNTFITPYLTVGATDGRHFSTITPNIYRFLPVPLKAEDTKRLHGINERIYLKDINLACQCYERILISSCFE